MNLTINPEYSKLVPELSESEFESLKESINEKGLWVPIIVNREGIILDGHHRYHACIHTGTKITTIERNFDTTLDEEIFVLECNAKRRQLDDRGKHQIYLNLKPRYAKQAELRRTEAGEKYGENHPKSLGLHDPKLSSKEKEENKSSTQAAKQTNLSRAKAEKMNYVKENNPELYEQIGKTDKMTVNKAYTTAKKNEKREKRQEEIKKIQVNLPEKVTLHNMPFQKAPITPNSVSLIITDPPYAEEHLHLFEDLAAHASRVLKEGGSLITYVGHANMIKVGNMMEKHGLSFHWPIAVNHSGPSASVFGKGILVGYKPMMWFTKGKYTPVEFVRDTIQSEFQGKELHEWAQSTVEADYYIKYLTIENEICYDPFLGQGTFGISAVRLKRQFIGCEIDKSHFETAQRLISALDS